MKMPFFSSDAFWGILLTLAGLSILLKVMFGINFPIFKIIFGLLFIYLGVRILLGNKGTENNSAIFGMNRMQYDENNPEHTILFSKGVIDYTKAPFASNERNAKVNVVFSDAVLLINEDIPMKIEVSCAFSGVSFPNGTSISFGSYIYTTKACSDTTNCLLVKASTVFGALRIIKASEDNPNQSNNM